MLLSLDLELIAVDSVLYLAGDAGGLGFLLGYVDAVVVHTRILRLGYMDNGAGSWSMAERRVVRMLASKASSKVTYLAL